MKAAVGTSPAADVPTLESGEIAFYSNNAGYDLFVPNERSWLTVKKFWQTSEGSQLADSDIPQKDIEVELWSYAKGANQSTAVKVALNVSDGQGSVSASGNILLNATNDWTYVYTKATVDQIYFVKEVNTGSQFEVSYSTTTGVEGGGLLTLTNKRTENADYELPSTGGAGTTPFTAVGGTMMLAALAYGVRRKRRRKGGAAD